jgi:hypothetical protein
MCALTTGACRCAILCIRRRSMRMCTWFERGRSNRRPAGHSLSRQPCCARTGTTRPIRSAPRRSNLGRRDVRAEMSCSHSLVRHARGPHFRRRAEHADAASLISPVPGQPASSHAEAALRAALGVHAALSDQDTLLVLKRYANSGLGDTRAPGGMRTMPLHGPVAPRSARWQRMNLHSGRPTWFLSSGSLASAGESTVLPSMASSASGPASWPRTSRFKAGPGASH